MSADGGSHSRTNLAELKSSTMFAAVLLSATFLFWTGEAAECTDAQTASASSVWAQAAANSACAPYVTQTDPVFVNAPCAATDCVDVVEDVATDLPDCTFSGINIKIEVQNALTICNGGDIRDSGSLTEANATATTAPPSSLAGSSSALTPEATTIAMDSYCNNGEIISLWNEYVKTATSEECASDSVVNGGNIDIIAQCDSNCTDNIRNLAEELPNCFYDFEYINKKQYVLNQLEGCDGSATMITISLLPDNAVDYSESIGSGRTATLLPSSGSSAIMVGDSASGSKQLNSGNNPSDNTMDASSGESGSSATPPHGGKILPWASLAVGIVVAFLN
ncbi:hypothetical protein PInf_009056 [Phytophthora infestans]|nr:hypothetical protein PInf_009056 [Phytophthora infestans]